MKPFLSRFFIMALAIFSFCFPCVVQGVEPDSSSPVEVVEDDVQKANDALIRLLEDPKTRAEFIDLLKKSESNTSLAVGDADASVQTEASSSDEGAADDQAPQATGIVIRIGEYTRVIADEFGGFLDRSMHAMRGLVLVLSGDIPVKWEKAQDVLLQVFIVLVSAYLAFFVGQFAARKTYAPLEQRAQRGGGFSRSLILVLTSAIDAATVGFGLAVGYFVALEGYLFLEADVTLQESLALNAFFIAGMANVALRFVFAPRRPELRLLPFDEESAGYWCGRLKLYSYWTNYGIFLAVPLANLAISFVLGNSLRFVIVFVGMVYLVTLVIKNRVRVREGIKTYAGSLQSYVAQRVLLNVAGLWHVLALLYIVAVFIVWVVRPFDATTIILRATGLSILSIMGGIALSLMMTKAIKDGVQLPAHIQEKLPALQYRLNAFVPRLLRLVRLIVFVATLLLLLDIWGVVSVLSWFGSDIGLTILSRYGSALLVLVVAFFVWLALMSWVDLKLRSRTGYIVSARKRTLYQLFRNAATIIILVMAVLLSLSEIGVDIGPLIAGAGVVGLAISFGAQTLVKDIITGAFIQIENAINEGDVVTVAGVTGTVEGITIRSLRMRDLDGTTHIIPFSSVDMVSNFMRGFSYHVAIIGVAYDTDIAFAKQAMIDAFRRLEETDYKSKLYGDLEMHGVVNFGASSIDIRARIKTSPGDQWSVGRAYNEFVKQVFDERDIEIPFPQVTYHAATPPFVQGAEKPKAARVTKNDDVAPANDAPLSEE